MGLTEVEVVDPRDDYAAMMERLFDFDAIRACSRAASPCASTPCTRSPALRQEILEAGSARRGHRGERVPLSDFGGRPPRPEPDLGQGALRLMMGPMRRTSAPLGR
jgi:phosphoglucomutase